jgi:hypothetical protein
MEGAQGVEWYPDGSLRGLMLHRENLVHLPCGDYVPNYHHDSARAKHVPSLGFYPSGSVRTARFDRPESVPLPGGGRLMAEKAVFHESGRLKRVFPLDGRISGFWSEKDERSLLEPVSLDLPFGRRRLFVSAVSFHETGGIRSVTLWPGEVIGIPVGGDELPCRIGFSLDVFGNLESLEPAVSIRIETPIGDIEAYDPDAIGVNADRNSLGFDREGKVRSLKSMSVLEHGTDRTITIVPRSNPHPFDCERRQYHPLWFIFGDKTLRVMRTGATRTIGYEFSLRDPLRARPLLIPTFANVIIPNGEPEGLMGGALAN